MNHIGIFRKYWKSFRFHLPQFMQKYMQAKIQIQLVGYIKITPISIPKTYRTTLVPSIPEASRGNGNAHRRGNPVD